MKYLIENKVIYDSDSGEFIIINADITEKKKLTHTANQVLAVLIASHGEVVERHSLLKEVWGANGQPESSFSLNQYISILRKTLTSLLGIDDVIITSPRVGFTLSPDITIKQYENNRKNSHPIINKLPKKLLVIVSVFIVLLIITFIFSLNRFLYLKDTEKVISNIDKCNVISYANVSKNRTKKVINIVKEIHPELQKQCKNIPAKLIIYVQDHIFYGKQGSVFLSFCPVDKENNRIIYCKSSYINKWGRNG